MSNFKTDNELIFEAYSNKSVLDELQYLTKLYNTTNDIVIDIAQQAGKILVDNYKYALYVFVHAAPVVTFCKTSDLNPETTNWIPLQTNDNETPPKWQQFNDDVLFWNMSNKSTYFSIYFKNYQSVVQYIKPVLSAIPTHNNKHYINEIFEEIATTEDGIKILTSIKLAENDSEVYDDFNALWESPQFTTSGEENVLDILKQFHDALIPHISQHTVNRSTHYRNIINEFYNFLESQFEYILCIDNINGEFNFIVEKGEFQGSDFEYILSYEKDPSYPSIADITYIHDNCDVLYNMDPKSSLGAGDNCYIIFYTTKQSFKSNFHRDIAAYYDDVRYLSEFVNYLKCSFAYERDPYVKQVLDKFQVCDYIENMPDDNIKDYMHELFDL